MLILNALMPEPLRNYSHLIHNYQADLCWFLRTCCLHLTQLFNHTSLWEAFCPLHRLQGRFQHPAFIHLSETLFRCWPPPTSSVRQMQPYIVCGEQWQGSKELSALLVPPWPFTLYLELYWRISPLVLPPRLHQSQPSDLSLRMLSLQAHGPWLRKRPSSSNRAQAVKEC